MPEPLRLGSIEFINSLPVDLGLLRAKENGLFRITQGPPSRLNQALLDGVLDVSPISSFWYGLHSDAFYLLPELSISSESGVESVLLFSHRPIWDLRGRRIHVTSKGRTTPALLEILCRGRYDFVPQFGREENPSELIPSGYDAALLIGDEALAARQTVEDHMVVVDLAEEWRAWTGRAIVFAVWAVRRDVFHARPEDVFSLHRAILDSKRWGLTHPDEVVREAGWRLALPEATLRGYFSKLNYEFDETMKSGLRLYFECAARMGLLESVAALEEIGGALAGSGT